MVLKLAEMDGVIGEIGKCNAKDIPAPNTSNTEVHLQNSIKQFLTQLQHTINQSTKPHIKPTHMALIETTLWRIYATTQRN